MTLALIQNLGIVELILVLIVLPALVIGGFYLTAKLIARAILSEKRRADRRRQDSEAAASRS